MLFQFRVSHIGFPALLYDSPYSSQASPSHVNTVMDIPDESTRRDQMRVVPLIIDQYARDQPSKSWASVPKSSDLADGFRDISYATFANAINRAAWYR